MLSASKKVDYGILLMASLPDFGSQEFRSLQDISQEKSLSAGFLSQVVIPLKKAGLVTAREGVRGGYQLSRPSQKISLAEIYEAIEGPLTLTNCLEAKNKCACNSQCPTKDLWCDLQDKMNKYFKKRKLSEFRKNKHKFLP